MNREIKFRGQISNSTIWAYGSFIQESRRYGSQFLILELGEDEESEDIKYTVYFPTIGQFTGLRDKNGKEIYEGDVVVYPPRPDDKMEVRWINYAIGFRLIPNLISVANDSWAALEVIGNIHENPELLRSAKGIEADTQ